MEQENIKLKSSDLFLPPDLRMILIGVFTLFRLQIVLHPSIIFVLYLPGAPRSGKSHFVKELLRNVDVMRPGIKYKAVLYCNPNLKSVSSKDKKFTEDFQKACGSIAVEFLSEIPTIEKLTSLPIDEEWRAMVIIDDFMDSSFKSTVIQQLFGRLGTHNYIDSVLLVQFAFSKAELFNSIYRCASAIVLFRNPSDRQMVRNINSKMFPKLSKKRVRINFCKKL